MKKEFALKPWHFRAMVISLVLSMAAYLVVSIWSGWQEVLHALQQVGWIGLAIALLLSLVNYLLRFVRWQIYLSSMGHTISHWLSWRIYLSGFALTTTPGKAGETLRGVLLKPLGVGYSSSIAAFLSERLSDLLAIVVMTMVGLTLYPQYQQLIFAGMALVLLGFFAIFNRKLLLALQQYTAGGRGKFFGFTDKLLNLLLQANLCQKPLWLPVTATLSLVAWLAEAYALYLVLHWMGADVSFQFAIFVYAISMLAGAISFLPGGLGGTEVVMISLLVLAGMPNADAVAATILIRMTTLWFAVAIGVTQLAVFNQKRVNNVCD